VCMNDGTGGMTSMSCMLIINGERSGPSLSKWMHTLGLSMVSSRFVRWVHTGLKRDDCQQLK
jgi:hypothetical protein